MAQERSPKPIEWFWITNCTPAKEIDSDRIFSADASKTEGPQNCATKV